MKVLIVHDFAAKYGGGEHMAFGLRDSLIERGHSARLLASSAKLIEGPRAEADVVTFGTMSEFARFSRVANPIAARDLWCELCTFRPDIVHVRMFMSQLSPLILPVLNHARRKFSVRSILHVVNADAICPIGSKLLPDDTECRSRPGLNCRKNGCLHWAGVARTIVQFGMMRRWMRVFEAVYANSHSMASQLRDDGLRCDGYIWNGIPDLPAGVDRHEVPTVLFAGRLAATKGIETLIACWAAVIAQHPRAVLVVAGDGPLRLSLQDEASRRGLLASVQFLGHLTHQQLSPIAERAWIQVIPSTWREPFGIACAEAMMRGLPVIATNSGGLAEQVIDGETGFLCPPKDAAAWAAAINRLLANAALCDQMGTAGRKRALEEFSQAKFINRWLALYESILNQSSTNHRSK